MWQLTSISVWTFTFSFLISFFLPISRNADFSFPQLSFCNFCFFLLFVCLEFRLVVMGNKRIEAKLSINCVTNCYQLVIGYIEKQIEIVNSWEASFTSFSAWASEIAYNHFGVFLYTWHTYTNVWMSTEGFFCGEDKGLVYWPL